MKPSKITKTNDVGFDDVRQWFDQHMRVGKLDLDDQEVYKNVYHQAKWCGIFQCVDEATPITMSDGSIKLIKDVVPGDYVKSFNIDTREFENDLVLNVFDQGIKDCVRFETDLVDQKLICTADHELLINNENGWLVWKTAGSIPGSLISYVDDNNYDYAHICDFSSKAGKHHVYDIEVENNHNFVANGIVVHNCTSRGAQKFFERSKPKSIDDIAVLTSIYRPGPLAAKIDEIWLDAVAGKEYDWGDKRINKILEKTKGMLIFQEGVMALAEHVGGFAKDKCDEVRRAIMKRSISGGDAAKAKVDQLRIDFVEGAMKNGYAKSVAENLYEKIAFLSGYAFNRCLHHESLIDTYEMTNEGLVQTQKMIKDVQIGDFVKSRDEKTNMEIYVQVLAVHYNGKKPIVELKMKTGEIIQCTIDHKFRTIETKEMLPLYEILRRKLSITVLSSNIVATDVVSG
jgi:hypothetical protein